MKNNLDYYVFKKKILCLNKDTPILPNKLGDSAGVFGAALLGKD